MLLQDVRDHVNFNSEDAVHATVLLSYAQRIHEANILLSMWKIVFSAMDKSPEALVEAWKTAYLRSWELQVRQTPPGVVTDNVLNEAERTAGRSFMRIAVREVSVEWVRTVTG